MYKDIFNCTGCICNYNSNISNKSNKRYHSNLQCTLDESNIIIQSKMSKEKLKNIINKVYSMNCLKCNNIIFEKLINKYKCILQCKHNIDEEDIIFIKSLLFIDFNTINKYIDNKYNDSCENCKKQIYNDILFY
jgi:hypothetical protein